LLACFDLRQVVTFQDITVSILEVLSLDALHALVDAHDHVLLALFDFGEVLLERRLVARVVLDAHLHLLILLGQRVEQLALVDGEGALLLAADLDVVQPLDHVVLLAEHLVHLAAQL